MDPSDFLETDLDELDQCLVELDIDAEEIDYNSFKVANLINHDELMEVLNSRVCLGTEFLTKPMETTVTLEGYISGIKLMEKIDIDALEATIEIPHICSNYMDLKHSSLIETPKHKKSNRGRKPKIRVRDRAKQGTGTSLNSQISFSIRLPGDGMFHKLMKFKVFRDGKIQISGAKYVLMTEILYMTNLLIVLLRGSRLAVSEVKLERLTAIMENYKFTMRIARKEAIDLIGLKRAILGASLYHNDPDVGDPISLLYVHYTQTQAMLCVKFDAPFIPKNKKTITVNIAVSGKVNILGCLGIRYAKKIAYFLDEVIRREGHLFIIRNRDCLWSRFSLMEDVVCPEHEYVPCV
jgi:hypothetical protein